MHINYIIYLSTHKSEIRLTKTDFAFITSAVAFDDQNKEIT